MHTHAPARHPLGPLGPSSPRPWAGRTCVKWSWLAGVHGYGDHPRSAALHGRSAGTSTHHRPFPRAVPKGPAAPHLPGNAAAPRLASTGSVGTARAPATRPQPRQDVCLCRRKAKVEGSRNPSSPRARPRPTPRLPQASALTLVGLGRKVVQGLPQSPPLPAGPSHSPVSWVNCPSPHPPNPRGPVLPWLWVRRWHFGACRCPNSCHPSPDGQGRGILQVAWHFLVGHPGQEAGGGPSAPCPSLQGLQWGRSCQEWPKASSTCP